ncbi:MAG: molybdenum ABC transporter ATP-binding protein, partial [Candidatus Omnitrophota bacterium]
EPANSLDLHARHKFSKVLGKIAKSGVGIIIVTHNLSDIIPAIARVVLVKKGRIFKDGPKRDIITDKNMSQLFKTSVKIKKDQGYYYAV